MMTTPYSIHRATLSWLTVLVLLTASPVYSQPVSEGWKDFHAEPVTPEVAQKVLAQREQMLAQQRSKQVQKQGYTANTAVDSMALAAAGTTTEFTQLADALDNDPRRIYQFVRNNFTYEPYFGALKGPSLTLKERSGNDFDQAAVLVELLYAAGFSASYQYGSMDIPVSAANGLDMAHWLGTEADATIIGGFIASGGIPAVNYGTSMKMDRLWVVAHINGTNVALDPAFKPSNQQIGINLATAMGYDQAELLAAAGGNQPETYSIQSLDTANLGNELTSLTTQLVDHLKQNHPNAQMQDIIGGLTILPDESSTLPSALPFPATTKELWTDIPAKYIHTVHLKHGSIDTIRNIPEIAGKKLSIHYVKDTSVVIPAAPVGASNLGGLYPGEDGSIFTWTIPNLNAFAIRVTSSLSGTHASAFKVVAGSGTQLIPAGGSASVQVQFTGINQSIGRKNAKLTLTYKKTNNTLLATKNMALTGAVEAIPKAEFYLDDVLWLSEQTTPSSGINSLMLTVDHPYADAKGLFADQQVEFPLKRTGTYVLASGFGGDRHSTLPAERQRYLDQLSAQGLANTSREVLGETLNVIGQSWLQQTQLNQDMTNALSGQRGIWHHRFGIVGQEAGYFIDVKAQVQAILPARQSVGQGAFQASNLVASAMEHGVLEQLQGQSNPALSTIKLFNLNNQKGQKFFLADKGNIGVVIPKLQGYSPSDLNELTKAIAGDATLILPENGQLGLNQWKGKGYIDYRKNGNENSIGMIIGGGLNGGYGGNISTVNSAVTQASYTPLQWPAYTTPTPKAADPVDLGSGAYLNQSTDISLGGSGPRGLSLTRFYNSQQTHQDDVGLGKGWNHSYNISLNRHSDAKTALGLRTPQDAAPLLVAAYAIRDLMTPDQPSLQAWVVGALIAQWGTEQIQGKTVTIQFGDRGMSYRQLPDGSFVSPPGSTNQLLKNSSGLYELRERFGTKMTFNRAELIQSLADIDGNALTFTYVDSMGSVLSNAVPRSHSGGDRLTQVKDAYNRTLNFTYTGDKLTKVTDNQGRSVNYAYTGDDLTRYTDVEGKFWQYGYDNLHQILTVTDPVNAQIVDNTYDANHRVIQQIAPRDNGASGIYTLHYTGLSAAEEDPLGYRTRYDYDDNGRTVAVENALGQITKTSYDGQGHAIQITDPLGHTHQMFYDGNQNPTRSLNALNQATRYSYDASLRLVQVNDALNHASQIDYDAEHHPIATRNALNQQTSSTYTASGLLQSQTDARNTSTTYTYDANGYPATAKTAAHPAVTSQYDAIGRLISLTDQAGAVTQFQYDKRGLLTQRTDTLGWSNTTQHDAAGRPISQTDRNGNITTLNYTPSGKVDQITYADNQAVRFDYDTRDHLGGMTDPTGTTANSYDAAGRLVGHTDPNGFQVQYAYDAAGNLTTLTYPGNKIVNYGYDALNRLSSVTIGWLNRTESYDYDAAGRLTQANRFNGSLSQYSYDNADRLMGLTHSANSQMLADYQYTLDANGNRVKALVTEPQGPVQLANLNQSFSYNSNRNRFTNIRYTNTDGVDYRYDNEGQLKSRTPYTYTLQPSPTHGRLVPWKTPGLSRYYTFDYAHRLTRQDNSSYVYDGVGNRLQATRNGVVTKYIYDASGNLLTEANASDQITRYYIYGKGLTAMVDNTTGQLYVYHFDGTGHTVALSNASRQTVNSYAYDPYGKLVGQAESIAQPFKYAGQVGVMAEGNNLYYMRARYYDANVGRFISEDPIGHEGGLNLYAYVGGNPVMAVDPSGLAATESSGSVLGKIWSAPNTVIGAVFGLAGVPFGADISFGNNAMQFTNHPFMSSTGAITFGNTILYGSNNGPTYNWPNGSTTGDHEMQHTLQGEQLGPLYLPSNLLGGTTGLIFDGQWGGQNSSNWNEAGPYSTPPTPWP